MVAIKTNLANKNNYGGKRSLSKIHFIVIHYTGNDGDTDESNGKFFKNNIVKASAHYFVDDDSITQSVPDNYIAWSVGGSRYSNYKTTGGASYYKKCTNTNSISIEICDDVKNGKVYPSAKTIQNALDLTEILMKKYNIPKSNVIRHFDVTGKACPSYWCGTKTKNAKWEIAFWNKINLDDKVPFKVKITSDTLTIRSGAGTKYDKVGTVEKDQVFTIVATKMNGLTKWGKLKSGKGWISLKYTKAI